jgi:tetratricopeptide (TPR) repeat protein
MVSLDREQTGVPGLISSLDSLAESRALLLICLLAFLAYANSLGGEFVFDDTDQIVTNQNLRSWTNLTTAFTTHVWAFRDEQRGIERPPPLPYYRPVFTVMLTAEYHLFGLWPQGWHLVSLLLHILSAAGVFYVILLLSHRKIVALFAASLFAVHPVHTESVSWISGMTDPLFTIFFLASFFFYVKSRREGKAFENQNLPFSTIAGRRALALSVALFIVSAFSKETGLSLVPLVFGYEFVENPGKLTARAGLAVRRVLPFIGASLLYLIPRYLVLRELMWTNPQAQDRPFIHTLLTLPFVVMSYLFHLAWPVDLSVTYDTRFITSAASSKFLLTTAGLVVIAAVLFACRKKLNREVWLALLLTFIPLLPVLKLGQVSREEYLVFDHYLYLSVAGWAYLITIGFTRLGALDLQKPSELKRAKAALAAMAVILLVSAAAAARENRSWSDSYALWSNAARVRPLYWAAHYNKGLALLDAERFDDAFEALSRAAALKSDEPDVFDALGRTLDAKGDEAGAISSFKHAIDLDPEKFESLNNIGHVYFKSGDYALAERYFAAAVAVRPQAATSLYNLGLCYVRQNRYADAIPRLERVLDLVPGDGETYYELGLAYEKTGRLADAIAALKRVREFATSQELGDKALAKLTRLQGQL